MERKPVRVEDVRIADQYGVYLPAYCFHCGKELIDDKHGAYMVHAKCWDKRRLMKNRLRKLRWKMMMEDPKIRALIAQTYKQLLEQFREEESE